MLFLAYIDHFKTLGLWADSCKLALRNAAAVNILMIAVPESVEHKHNFCLDLTLN